MERRHGPTLAHRNGQRLPHAVPRGSLAERLARQAEGVQLSRLVIERDGRERKDVPGVVVEDERLFELDRCDRMTLRAEPPRPGGVFGIQRRDRSSDLGARRSGDLRSPN
jgi:hypothetical protein